MEERCLCTCLFTRTEKNLKNQMDFITQYCNAKGVILDERISDIGSGLNYRRPKWNKLLQDVEDKRIAKIFITYKDRFTRFGFDWFEDFCQRHGTEIVILNNPNTSPDQELVEDLKRADHGSFFVAFNFSMIDRRRRTATEWATP